MSFLFGPGWFLCGFWPCGIRSSNGIRETNGKTINEIASLFGVSMRRIFQIKQGDIETCKICKRKHFPTPEGFHLVIHPNQTVVIRALNRAKQPYIISKMVEV